MEQDGYDYRTAHKSRSLEQLHGMAVWAICSPVVVELVKGARGLGFSVLDYQVRYTSCIEV
jgi:hypothetical protein